MAVRKWSVSVEEELAGRVEEHVGDRGLSGFVARAVEHELERDALAEYLDELDAEYGKVPETLVEDYESALAVLILDSEALSSLARPEQNTRRHERVRAALRSAERRNGPVRVPSVVLVELYRGAGHDEPVDHVLGRGFARVVTTGARIARIAGHLLADAGRGSEMAVDALVVATALRLGGGVILTHDPRDLEMLASDHPNVRIASV